MRLSEKDYNFIYSKVPRMCIDILPIIDDRVLMEQREFEPYIGLYGFIGGGVRFNETLQEAASRIALIEVGTNVILKEVINYFEFLKEPGNGFIKHSVSIVFRADLQSEPTKGKYLNKKDSAIIHPEQLDFLIKNKIL